MRFKAQEQWQMLLLSTITMEDEVAKHMNNAHESSMHNNNWNEAAKHKNNGQNNGNLITNSNEAAK